MIITLQRNMCDDKAHNLLIDFNSPLQGRLDKTFCELIPLVPLPNPVNTDGKVVNSGSPEADNNPFDFVDHQTNLNVRMLNDPFELAYYSTGKNDKESDSFLHKDSIKECNENKDVVDSEDNLHNNVTIGDVLDNSTREDYSSLGFLNEQVCDRAENSLIAIEDVTDPCIEVCVSFSDISPVRKLPSEGEKKFERISENPENNNDSNTDIKMEVSLMEALDNSEEALKAIVANRVNTCIQNALHQSKLYYNNFAFNQDSNVEHAVVPIRHNTSSLYNSFLNEHPKREMNLSAINFTSSYLNNAQSFRQISKDPVASPVLKPNWNTPQRNISLVESHAGLNKAFCNSSNYSFSNTGLKHFNSSSCEMLKITSPCFKIKPDLLECVGNLELRNSSCIGSLLNSDFDRDKQMGNIFPKFEDKYGKHTEFLPVSVCDGSREVLVEKLVKKNDNTICSPVLPDSKGSPDDSYKNGKEEDDTVFLEAHNMAFMFRSFTRPSSDDEEEDILICKPEWEKSMLKLPKFNSEENDTELVEGITDCKISSSQEITKDDTSTNYKSNKLSSKLNKEALTPPDIVLPVVLPMVEKTDNNIKIKSKHLQQTGKKGPIKAVLPLGNMVRTTGIENKISSSNGNKDNKAVGNGSSHFTFKSTVASGKCQRSSQLELSETGKAKSNAASKMGCGTRSFTSASSQSSNPTVKCANSLTSGIPLVSPPIYLKNKESRVGTDSAQSMTPVQMLHSQQISGASNFNLSGLVATSTPARKVSYSSSRNLKKTIPSPILVKGTGKELPSTEIPKTKKSEASLKNKSFDQVKNKELSNKPHSRSKSASYAQPKQLPQSQKENLLQYGKFSYNSAKKISVSSDKCSRPYHIKSQPEVQSDQSGILKPLKLNGNSISRKQNIEMNQLLLGSSKKKRSPIQLFPKLKKNSLLEIDKENFKP